MKILTNIYAVTLIASLSLPAISFAAEHREVALGVLQRPENSSRLERVTGIVTGMTQKLQNLSQQLDNFQTDVQGRIAALQAAGHAISVDTELTAFTSAIAAAKDNIQSIIQELSQIPASSKPSQQVLQIHTLVRSLATKLIAVRTSFQALKLAVAHDLQSENSSPTPLTTPTL
ncbi:MAG TPA: hypothetical protein VLG69_05310 [Candidatus Andersenbacteria bacterium]|nr:hypothetical protein [Candidatus Andersenbacteria bacterium]